MTFVWWGLIAVLLCFGFLGCFVNKVPGPLATFLSVLVAMFGLELRIDGSVVAIVGVLAAASMILSKVLVSAVSKLQEYSKRASAGTTIGSIIGLLFLGAASGARIEGIGLILIALLGFVVVPFVLAFLFELTKRLGFTETLKRAGAATATFLADTFLKVVVFGYAFYAMFFMR